MDSLWAVPRAKSGRFGNDEKASCVTVSRRRSVLPPLLLSPPLTGLVFPPHSPCTEELEAPLSIHLNIIISFRELGFQDILVSHFSSFSPASRRPNRAIRAREFDLPVSSSLIKTAFRPSPLPGPIHPPPSPTPSTFRSTITYGSIGYGR